MDVYTEELDIVPDWAKQRWMSHLIISNKGTAPHSFSPLDVNTYLKNFHLYLMLHPLLHCCLHRQKKKAYLFNTLQQIDLSCSLANACSNAEDKPVWQSHRR